MSETPKRTLKDILSQHLDETLREILALERYGAKVRDECREWVKFHALKNDDGRLTVGAGVLNLMPLPPIDREGASRE